jgi:hypothetical protein
MTAIDWAKPITDPAVLRRAIVDGAREHRLAHRQFGWVTNQEELSIATIRASVAVNECDTSACIAGWAAILTGRDDLIPEAGSLHRDEAGLTYTEESIGDKASAELGLSALGEEQLFFEWDDEFALLKLEWLADHPEEREIPVAVEENMIESWKQDHPEYNSQFEDRV